MDALFFGRLFSVTKHLCTAAAVTNHYNLAFFFYEVPTTTGWAEAAWDEKFA